MSKKIKVVNKVFPKENEAELKSTIQKLKARSKKLEKENKKLKYECKTLEQAFKETSKYLKGQLQDYSLEEVLEAIKERKSLKREIKKLIIKCPDCGKGKISKTNIPNVGVLELCDSCSHTEMLKNADQN